MIYILLTQGRLYHQFNHRYLFFVSYIAAPAGTKDRITWNAELCCLPPWVCSISGETTSEILGHDLRMLTPSWHCWKTTMHVYYCRLKTLSSISSVNVVLTHSLWYLYALKLGHRWSQTWLLQCISKMVENNSVLFKQANLVKTDLTALTCPWCGSTVMCFTWMASLGWLHKPTKNLEPSEKYF